MGAGNPPRLAPPVGRLKSLEGAQGTRSDLGDPGLRGTSNMTQPTGYTVKKGSRVSRLQPGCH
jgi:hypothetical protein